MGHAETRRHAQLEHTGGFALVVADAGEGRLQGLQVAADGLLQAFAGFGQGELAGGTLEQPHAQVALQHGDIAADRRGRQGQAPGGRGEAAGFGAADE
ncbi:hypothetical protein FQZ97_1070010 [compost metagenome]